MNDQDMLLIQQTLVGMLDELRTQAIFQRERNRLLEEIIAIQRRALELAEKQSQQWSAGLERVVSSVEDSFVPGDLGGGFDPRFEVEKLDRLIGYIDEGLAREAKTGDDAVHRNAMLKERAVLTALRVRFASKIPLDAAEKPE